jgi:transcriptional regulator with XRE-family HTH domain
MVDIKFEVGKRIKESRKLSGYTQKQVAGILLMTQQQYSRFENGIFELSYSQLIKISELFDVSVDYLLGIKQI